MKAAFLSQEKPLSAEVMTFGSSEVLMNVQLCCVWVAEDCEKDCGGVDIDHISQRVTPV